MARVALPADRPGHPQRASVVEVPRLARGPMTRTSSSALEEIRTRNLLIRSNHAYCDVLNEICAVQPTGRANRARNSQMLSVRRPRGYGATYGARSINGVAHRGFAVVRPVNHHAAQSHFGPVTSSHRCLVVGGHRKLPSGGQQNLRQAATECGGLP
jgi:hypothetical protein